MKTRHCAGFTGIVILSFFSAKPAEAGKVGADLAVNVNITPGCTIQSVSVQFGPYDPLGTNATAPLTGAGSLKMKCTLHATATIMLQQGLHPGPTSTDGAPDRRMTNGAGQAMTYGLFQDAGYTTLWGNTTQTGYVYLGTGQQEVVPVYGRIPAAQSVLGGLYNDVVVAVVVF